MSVAREAVLHRMVLEVRYDEGVVYLDKCGSLTVSLQKVLGEPFTSILPSMEFGQFTSEIERLSIRYGPKYFGVEQAWFETLARVESLAGVAWAEVARSLGVESKVTRCGLRLFVLWGTEDEAEADALMARSGLAKETPAWSEIMGIPEGARSFSAVASRSDKRVRAGISTVSIKTDGKLSPDEIKFAPPSAVQLDLDYSVGDGKSRMSGFTKDKLLGFIKTSYSDSKRLIQAVTGRFDVEQ